MSNEQKIMIVTGAGSGIGRATAKALASHGVHVVVIGRSTERVQPVVDEINAAKGSAEPVAIDLSSLQSIRDGAAKIAASHKRIDALVNNAGIWAGERKTTVDGFEQTWGVNVLAPHLLAKLLLEPLRAANGRVVNVSSREHAPGKINWDDLQYEKGYGAQRVYRQSKLAITMLTNELASRESDLRANSLHPGVISTELFRNFPGFIRFWIKLLMRSPEGGAQPQIKLATDPAFEATTGKYFFRFNEKAPNPAASDPEARKRLWEIVESHIG